MIGGLHAIGYRFGAVDGEIGVEFNHGGVRLDRIGSVDLDLIIILAHERK